MFAVGVAVGIALGLALGWSLWSKKLILNQAAAAEQSAERERLVLRAANFERKLETLSECSGDGIIMADEHGTIVHANEPAHRMFDAELGWMRGKPIIQATLMPELEMMISEARGQRDATTRDLESNAGRARTLRVSIQPFEVGLSGRPESMVVLTDISELVRLETMRRDFVANVSHELRTPLASIRAVTETLQAGALEDAEVAQTFLESILRESDRLTRIVEDLLILTTAESRPPETQPVDLSRLVSDIVERNRLAATDHGLELDIEAEPALTVMAAPDQIEQVIINLVSNAIKYTPSGGRVSVGVTRDEENAVLTVADTGIGIMQDDLQRIFERFYRVDKARSRESGGTGLGLSIVKNIIERHGGKVGVESRFNHGSTFRVILPLADNTESE